MDLQGGRIVHECMCVRTHVFVFGGVDRGVQEAAGEPQAASVAAVGRAKQCPSAGAGCGRQSRPAAKVPHTHSPMLLRVCSLIRSDALPCHAPLKFF